MKKLYWILLAFCVSTAFAQSTCDKLVKLKGEIYGFNPKELSDEEQTKKMSELDKFWDVVVKDPKNGVPCVEKLIHDEQKDRYFCFDAASLLFSLKNGDKYQAAIVEGLQKTDLSILALASYVDMCCALGRNHVDISVLAANLLACPDPNIFIVQHALTLNGIDASLFLFNTMDSTKAEQTLIETINNGSPLAKHNAAVVLNLLSTDNGDKFLNDMMDKKQLSDSTIAFIQKDRETFILTPKNTTGREEIMRDLTGKSPKKFPFYGFAGSEDLIRSSVYQLSKKDIDLIRKYRVQCVHSVSDESLSEYFAATSILMSVRNKKQN